MTDVHVEDHSTPIRTPRQLIIAVLLAFLTPILLIVMIVQMVTGGLKVDIGGGAMTEDAVAQRLKPVGDVVLAETGTAPGVRSGAEVVKAVCQACHGAGLVGAPKIGDKAAWQPRLALGVGKLHEHAINGIRSMPARGGNPSLSDAEVNAAVDYMLSQSK
jgi:cytochrome c5